MVLNVILLMHSATINSNHVSVSSDKWIKANGINNVVIMMFPNIVLWTVVCCFGRHADTFKGMNQIKNAIMLQSLISAASSESKCYSTSS